MNIVAKMRCHSVEEQFYGPNSEKSGENITLGAVHSEDPKSENYSFSQATPNASVTMCISNPSAFGAFVQDKEYYVRFEEAQ